MIASHRLAVICLHTCPWQRPGADDAGGMNVYVRQTAAALAARGLAVDVFVRLHAHAASCCDPPPGVRLFHVPAGPLEARKSSLHRWLEPFVAEVLDTGGHPEGPYSAVSSHYWLSGLAAIDLTRHWRVPHLASFHTLALAKQLAFPVEAEPSARCEGERRVIEHADRLLAVSQHERGVLTDLYGADPDTIVMAPPGVDPERFHPRPRQEARERLGLPREARLLLAVGRTTAIKGHEVLLEALARLPDSKVLGLFVGGRLDGPFHREREALVRRLELEHRVRFVGSVEHDALPDYYAACDVCVVPSLYESFGLAALEAIACGRPVVASRVGGLPSIVGGSSLGTLVTPGSVRELVEALERVLGQARPSRIDGATVRELPSWSAAADAIRAALEKVA